MELLSVYHSSTSGKRRKGDASLEVLSLKRPTKEKIEMSYKSTAVQMAPESASPQLVEPKTLIERIEQVHENIARRAFEFFEKDGGRFGHELDHWFKAEGELLHPVHMTITESDDALTVQAEVPGFNTNELQISLEPKRLTISGKRESRREGKNKGSVVYQEECSSELLRVIDLPVEVDATKTTSTLKNGVLELNIPKSARTQTQETAWR